MELYVHERSGNACIDIIKARPGCFAVDRERTVVMEPIIAAPLLFPDKMPDWGT